MNPPTSAGGPRPLPRWLRGLLAKQLHADEIVVLDFEYSTGPDGLPQPVCLVAHEIVSGRTFRLFGDDLLGCAVPPFAHGPNVVTIAYYASAEMGCYLALRWALPARVLDLFAEFRNSTNGRRLPYGAGLLGALAFFDLPAIGGEEKEDMRALAMRGGPYTAAEQAALLDYCQGDVEALLLLLPRLVPTTVARARQAFLRGRYTRAVARMERAGVPVDAPLLGQLRVHWRALLMALVENVDQTLGVYEGTAFREKKFRKYLARHRIPWPILPSGRLALDSATFKAMATAHGEKHPALQDLHELRETLGRMRLENLAVWADGRNRTMLSMFRAKTGRNQPSNTKFIYGPAVWLRFLIQPRPGYALAYIDWSQQEFGIAAALSGDPAMLAAYASGDPYLAFAKQAGAAPAGATKASHEGVRELFKQCVLAVQYLMGAESLAARIGQPVAQARELLRLHRQAYPVFWAWSDRVVNHAYLYHSLRTVFGWTLHVGPDANERSLRNYLVQGNGAEMLRLACSFATERGIRVCAPVHDALLIEAPEGEIDEAIAVTQEAMAEASEIILGTLRLRSDVKVVRHPDRYEDKRGRAMWERVMAILAGFAREPR